MARGGDLFDGGLELSSCVGGCAYCALPSHLSGRIARNSMEHSRMPCLGSSCEGAILI